VNRILSTVLDFVVIPAISTAAWVAVGALSPTPAYEDESINELAKPHSPEESGAHLVLTSYWKKADIRFVMPSSVTMPMSSMEQCSLEGNKAIKRN